MIQTARPCRSVARCAGCRRSPSLVTTHGSQQQHLECARCGVTTARYTSFRHAAVDWDAGRLHPIADTPHADSSPEHVLLRMRAHLATHRAGAADAVKHAA
jgi:hypothetical protein